MSAFPISAALLDAMVLALVQKEDTYGYKITREIQAVISISESTLYPVCAACKRAVPGDV